MAQNMVVQLVVKANDQASKKIAGLKSKIGGAFKGFASFGNLLATGVVAAGIKSFIDAAGKQETVLAELGVAVQNTGVDYRAVKKDIQDVTAALQKKTIYGDEEQQAALKSLILLSGDYQGSLEALPATLDLAAGMSMDLVTASRFVGMAMAGNVSMLGRYISEFRGVKQGEMEQSEMLDILTKKFGGMAEIVAKTGTGQMKQFGNAIGDVKEVLGAELLPTINNLVKSLMPLLPDIANVGKIIFRVFASAVEQVTAMGKILVAVFKGKFSEIGDIVEASGNRQRKMWKKTTDKIITEEERANLKHLQMTKSRIEAELKEAEKKEKAEEKAREKRLEATEEINDQLNEIMLSEADNKRLALKEELEAYRKLGVDKVLIEKYGSEARVKIAQDETAKKNTEIDKETQKRIDSNNKTKEAAAQLAKDTVSFIADVAKKDLAFNKKRYDDRVARGEMTQEQADIAYAKDKKNFKKLQKAEAYVSGALAIRRAFTSAAGMPPPLNIIVGTAQAALQAAMTKQQISTINAAERGGVTMGDQIIRVGEKKKPELILPLEDERVKSMLEKIGGFGGVGISVGNLTVNNTIEGIISDDNIDVILNKITGATKSGVVSALEMAQTVFSEGKEREELS